MSPNLLFLYTDEQRFDTLAAYGNTRIEMPNLNRLAKEACVCDRAYVTQPVCTPARSSILTGLMPHSNGCVTNNIPLSEEIPCLPEMLPAGRYSTAHFGKWHLGDEVFPQHGFDEWAAIDQYNDYFRPSRDKDALCHYALWLKEHGVRPEKPPFFGRMEAARLPEEYGKPAFLGQTASDFIRRHRDKPFCLYVNFLEPHMPFHGPRDHQYDPDSIPLPENFHCPPNERNHFKLRARHGWLKDGLKHGTATADPDSVRRLIARYWGLCSLVDTHCGVILDTLRDCGLWDNTIIVFTSDHGDQMGSHQLVEKGMMYEESIRVPLLIKLPGQRQLRRIEGPVSQVDLVPTLLELMGTTPPGHLEGASRASTLKNEGTRFDGNVVVEWNGANGAPPPQYDWPDPEIRPERIDAAHTDRLRTIFSEDGRWKLNYSPDLGEHELFDLQNDPHECRSCFGDEGTGEVTRDLVDQLRAWSARTKDTVTIDPL